MRFGRPKLEYVVEDETGKLSLLLTRPYPMRQHREESVHKLEAAQAEPLHTFGLISKVGEYLQDGLSDFRG